MVESPCIKVCELNAAGFCTGCGRDRREIGGWMQMSDAQKRETIKVAAARLKGVARPDRKIAPAG